LTKDEKILHLEEYQFTYTHTLT